MERLFITNLTIEKVRYLRDISIPLSENRIKHLILTGKNGSGKTSVVEALSEHLNNVFTDQYFEDKESWLESDRKRRDAAVQDKIGESEILKLEKKVHETEEDLKYSRRGLKVSFNHKACSIFGLKEKYHYILAYYQADRIFKAEQPRHVEKVQLKDRYGLNEFPRDEFVKYLLDLKMTEALARNNDKTEKADEIKRWFE